MHPLVPVYRLEPDPAHIEDAFQPDDFDEFAELEEVLLEHWPQIRTHTELGRYVDIHNIRVIGQPPNAPSVEQRLEDIFEAYQTGFAINILHGYILENSETGEFRYFYFGENTRLFDTPRLIRNRASFERFLADFRKIDSAEKAVQHRPNTKWTFYAFTNTAAIVWRRRAVFAAGRVRLTNYIARNKGLLNFRRDANNHAIVDRLCFFRCLAHAIHPDWDIDQLTSFGEILMKCYCRDILHIDPQRFRGISLQDIPSLEYYFNLPITVYQLLPYVNERLKKKKKRKPRRKKKKAPRPRRHKRCGGFLDDEAACASDSDSDEEEEAEVCLKLELF